MSVVMNINLGLAVLNAVLALVVGAIYLRTHKQIRSPFTAALSLFAIFFIVHNVVLVYHWVTMMASFGGVGEWYLLVEGLLQTGALASLLYAVTR